LSERENTPVPFKDWFDQRFAKPDGSAYSERQRSTIVKRYQLPLIKVGWNKLIIPAQADQRLAELAKFREERPRRGRPRLAAD
jgi:hypothetical protein